nr:MAG TPA: Protein of unknown function (DUF2737) [Caudoviricetes sp.]
MGSPACFLYYNDIILPADIVGRFSACPLPTGKK